MTAVGFEPQEIDLLQPTRAARLKWVVVVDSALPPGRAVNAAVCVASATARSVAGLLGPDGEDATGSAHPGLPWAGCTVLAATGDRLAALRAKAADSPGVFVADMPVQAQRTRVYDDYLRQLSEASDVEYLVVSVVGPRNRVDKLVKGLELMP
ncbi:DUF2000 domain-containing protein [Saccharothrix yanglingensis]|uniref:DUF2000 domain-containing protein n=1 Tax=Saccharothrix yanglingensis TaxID=659496 RepID=A0ABU0X7K6_9PSEU|nr:DUF2000 domain-containing protein [Saccharothrix yanglingensis]MDQ2586594.1 hypothetical protein [Saccharothrix yanglingensis]